jgi:alkane 1-monooxygenase
VIYSALAIWLGWDIWAYLLLSALWGGFQLTSANYIEHYGLKRKKMPNGRYEKCQPHHSWNSNHLLSNWTLFHLQRHSDHHAYPMRRYQSLRNFDKIPQLPTGYYGMFLLAYVPPLWFRVMDKRVWQAVEKDWDRLNILPGCEEQYRARLVTK